jgi:sugar phosphate permease
VSALWMFYFFYFFNALGYVCGGPLPNQVLLSQWFDRTRGRAMGIAYLGIGIGGALVPFLANRLTQQFGWRISLQILGALIVLIAFPLAYMVKERSTDGDRTSPAEAGQAPPLREVLTTPAFYLLAIGSMCSIAAVGGTNQHLKLFLSLDRGYSQGDAAQVISLVLAVSIAGRLLMGWLADRIPRKQVMLVIYLLVASAVPLLIVSSSGSLMYVFAIVFGLGLGGEYMIIPLMAAELFGVRVLGRVMGIVLTADGVAEATAPMLVGYLRDLKGNYDYAFFLLVGAALVGAAAVALLPRTGSRKSEVGSLKQRMSPVL